MIKIAIVGLLALTSCVPWPPVEQPPIPTPTVVVTPTSTPVIPSPEPQPEKCQLDPAPKPSSCVFKPESRPMYIEDVTHAQNQAALAGFVNDDGIVTDEIEYTKEVAKNLRKMGYCAIAGLNDEVWLKKYHNDFSEHYDIVRSDNVIITMFAARCTPAYF